MSKRVFHQFQQSSFVKWQALTGRPISSSTCWSQVLRGRFQPVAGGVPVKASMDSCNVCDNRQMWPKSEWRRSEIRESRSVSPVVSFIAEGRRLSRPSWLATYRDSLPARTRTVTHPSTNRARRRVTTLIDTNSLPVSHANNHASKLCKALAQLFGSAVNRTASSA